MRISRRRNGHRHLELLSNALRGDDWVRSVPRRELQLRSLDDSECRLMALHGVFGCRRGAFRHRPAWSEARRRRALELGEGARLRALALVARARHRHRRLRQLGTRPGALPCRRLRSRLARALCASVASRDHRQVGEKRRALGAPMAFFWNAERRGRRRRPLAIRGGGVLARPRSNRAGAGAKCDASGRAPGSGHARAFPSDPELRRIRRFRPLERPSKNPPPLPCVFVGH